MRQRLIVFVMPGCLTVSLAELKGAETPSQSDTALGRNQLQIERTFAVPVPPTR